MPHRSGGRGSLILQRRYPGVGEIRRATGIYNEDDFHELCDRVIPVLLERDRTDLLIALRDNLITGDELLRSFRLKGLMGLPSAEHVKPLAEAVERWLAEAEIAPRTRRDYREALDALLALDAPGASVARLPLMLKRYREIAGGGRQFNKARAAARSFASSLTGRYNDLWVQLTNVRPRPVRSQPGNPQSPKQARAKARELGPRYGAMWWTLCITGMSGGPEGPYFLDAFDVLDDRILIHGTKTEGRDRVVPRLFTPVRKFTEYAAFRRQITKVGLRPNDGRKTFTHWCEEAGIRRTIRRRLLGHGKRDTTDIYEDFPVETQLGEIRERLLAYIGEGFEPAQLEVMGA